MTNELLFWVDATKNESVTGGEQSVLTKVNLVTEGGKCLKKTTFFKKDRLRRAVKTPPGQLAIYVDKMNAEISAILFSKRTVVKQQNTGWGGGTDHIRILRTNGKWLIYKTMDWTFCW